MREEGHEENAADDGIIEVKLGESKEERRIGLAAFFAGLDLLDLLDLFRTMIHYNIPAHSQLDLLGNK